MKIKELKYNLYLINFAEVEKEILYLLKIELDKYGINSYEDLPKTDYTRLLKYYTLLTICKTYNGLNHKKNTLWYVDRYTTNPDILKFVLEIKKYFPIPLYTDKLDINSTDQAVQTEITLNLKEFRYSFDYCKYSFTKIKKFCKENELDSLLTGFKA